MHNSDLIDCINEITGIFSASSDLNRNLLSAMKKITVFTGAEAWSLQIIDDPFFKNIGLKKSLNIKKFRYEKNTGITGLVYEKGVPVNVRDTSKDRRFNKETDAFNKLQIRSLMCSPLKAKGGIVGVLRVINKKRANSFSDTEFKLLVSMSHSIAVILEQAYLYKKIDEITVTDDLTGLYNIRYLNRSIEMEIERSQRYGSMFSLIFLDVDNLKKVNERFGHLAGSKVLIETARLLQDNLRKIDVTIRYGGDEFVLILPQTALEGGFLVADRLRKIIAKHKFLKNENTPINLTASFGVVSFPGHADSKEALIKLADKAMYRGKVSTKNVVFAAK